MPTMAQRAPLRRSSLSVGRVLPPRYLSGRAGPLLPMDLLPSRSTNSAPGPKMQPKPPACNKRVGSAPPGGAMPMRRRSLTSFEILGRFGENTAPAPPVAVVSPDSTGSQRRFSLNDENPRQILRFGARVRSIAAAASPVAPSMEAPRRPPRRASEDHGAKEFSPQSGSFVERSFFDSILGAGAPPPKRRASRDIGESKSIAKSRDSFSDTDTDTDTDESDDDDDSYARAVENARTWPVTRAARMDARRHTLNELPNLAHFDFGGYGRDVTEAKGDENDSSFYSPRRTHF